MQDRVLEISIRSDSCIDLRVVRMHLGQDRQCEISQLLP